MARKTLIAGNWKMNGLLADGVDLAKAVAAEVKKMGKPGCEFLVCPPFTLLTSVKKALRGAKVALGAQDVHFNPKGAHTGDISPLMLKDAGCQYVIVGHSERRAGLRKSRHDACRKERNLQKTCGRILSEPQCRRNRALLQRHTLAVPASHFRVSFLLHRLLPRANHVA